MLTQQRLRQRAPGASLRQQGADKDTGSYTEAAQRIVDMGPRAQLLTLAAQCGHTHAEARFSARAGPLKRLSHTIGAALELCWGGAAVDGQRGDTVDV